MKTLIFFDVSIHPSQGYIEDGRLIPIEDLIKIKSVHNPEIFQNHCLVSSLWHDPISSDTLVHINQPLAASS